ncbi:hypothetical protein [Serratia proteamaculans]
MEILSHRGYWKVPAEKNSSTAFQRSFDLGYGTETDVRDFNGQLVISHDIPDASAISADSFFEQYNNNKKNNHPTLALNVKADGLQKILKDMLLRHNVQNYFFFDMAIPDLLAYKKNSLKFFVRFSEYEPESKLIDDADGIWLDGFEKTIVDTNLIDSFLQRGKKVCLVSPELHSREHLPVWEEIKSLPQDILSCENFMLCTDLPEDATRFFYGN